MREPPARVQFIGQPLVSTPIMGLCGFAIYAWSQNPQAIIVGIGAIIGLIWTGKAQNTMNQYRRWKKAWDGMAEPAAPKPAGPMLGKAIIALLVVGGFALAAGGGMPAGGGAVEGLVMIGAVIAGTVLLARRALSGGRTGRAAKAKATTATVPVRVAVTRPVLAVPDLKGAYDALPAHSWRAIETTRK